MHSKWYIDHSKRAWSIPRGCWYLVSPLTMQNIWVIVFGKDFNNGMYREFNALVLLIKIGSGNDEDIIMNGFNLQGISFFEKYIYISLHTLWLSDSRDTQWIERKILVTFVRAIFFLYPLHLSTHLVLNSNLAPQVAEAWTSIVLTLLPKNISYSTLQWKKWRHAPMTWYKVFFQDDH